jgi:hypothetical protein
LKGNFPIGFLIWETHNAGQPKQIINEVPLEVLDKNSNPIGEKIFYNLPSNNPLAELISQSMFNSTHRLIVYKFV